MFSKPNSPHTGPLREALMEKAIYDHGQIQTDDVYGQDYVLGILCHSLCSEALERIIKSFAGRSCINYRRKMPSDLPSTPYQVPAQSCTPS